MSKLNNKIFIIFLIMIVFFIGGKYFIANRSDILLSYNEKDYEHTQFLVDVEGNKSISGYYLIDENYYKYNKLKSKEWIEEDIKVKKLGNQYCEPRIDVLKSIKNLEKTTSSPINTTPDLSMSFTIQQDKLFDKNSWNYYDGKISFYLKDNIMSLDKFGIESDKYYISKNTKYYILDDEVKDNINKIIQQVLSENK
ncbi:Uncharacterised protein [uncultured Clostridium sp.]|nr:Uncharacterised protein [uncultured Clostridium sp.]SCI83536.1 Uncharacterised protein [uncultured Clostridium sp.]